MITPWVAHNVCHGQESGGIAYTFYWFVPNLNWKKGSKLKRYLRRSNRKVFVNHVCCDEYSKMLQAHLNRVKEGAATDASIPN